MVWLAGDLKLKETQYSKDLYSPGELAYPGNNDDDGDGGEDSKATPSYQPRKRCFR